MLFVLPFVLLLLLHDRLLLLDWLFLLNNNFLLLDGLDSDRFLLYNRLLLLAGKALSVGSETVHCEENELQQNRAGILFLTVTIAVHTILKMNVKTLQATRATKMTRRASSYRV